MPSNTICPALAPKEENIRYYENTLQAQAAEFRPCKRCLPKLAPQTQISLQIKQLSQAIASEDSLAAMARLYRYLCLINTDLKVFIKI
jgi:methylphosphotriester-DNA--protein-cysteine methyltransferase